LDDDDAKSLLRGIPAELGADVSGPEVRDPAGGFLGRALTEVPVSKEVLGCGRRWRAEQEDDQQGCEQRPESRLK
jgi:hypothetical protein